MRRKRKPKKEEEEKKKTKKKEKGGGRRRRRKRRKKSRKIYTTNNMQKLTKPLTSTQIQTIEHLLNTGTEHSGRCAPSCSLDGAAASDSMGLLTNPRGMSVEP